MQRLLIDMRSALSRRLLGRLRQVMALCAVTAFCAAVQSLPARAQSPFGSFGEEAADPDNPFGAGNLDTGGFGGFGPAPAVDQPAVAASGASAQAEPEEDLDPIVRIIRESPPRTPEKMADAITWLTRIERYDEIGRLLDEIAQAKWPESDLSQMARHGGNALWLRLQAPAAELSAEQRALARNIMLAPSREAKSPEWIDSWIARLGSNSAGQRRLAQLRLQDSGRAGIQRLVDQLLAGDSSVAPALLANTVTKFGDAGTTALQTAAQVSDQARAAHLLLAVAELPGNSFTSELGAAIAGNILNEENREALLQQLSKKYASIPDREAINRYLERKFDSAIDNYQAARTSDDLGGGQVWRLTEDGNGIRSEQSAAHAQVLARAAQLATLRLRSNGLDDAGEITASILQNAYHLQPTLVDERLPGQVPVLFGGQLELNELIAGYHAASGLQFHGAALRTMQLIGQRSWNVDETTVSLKFLAERLQDPRPVIRYAAFEAIASLDPKRNYPGAEPALDTALEMSQLDGGPHALVIGLYSDRRHAAEQQLQVQAGGQVTSAASAQAAYSALGRTLPIELIFIVDRVADQSVFEMIQRLRGGKWSHALPIVVLTDQLYEHERDLIASTPGVSTSTLSRGPEQMQLLLEQINDRLDIALLSRGDRAHFAKVATGFLKRIAADRQRYGFYPIGGIQEQIFDATASLAATDRVDLLTGLSSAEGQRELLDMCANGSLSDELRFVAAQGFGNSVRRFGLALGKNDILSAYDNYNQLGPTDPGAVKSLGLVLDVLEAHAGRGQWPDEVQ